MNIHRYTVNNQKATNHSNHQQVKTGKSAEFSGFFSPSPPPLAPSAASFITATIASNSSAGTPTAAESHPTEQTADFQSPVALLETKDERQSHIAYFRSPRHHLSSSTSSILTSNAPAYSFQTPNAKRSGALTSPSLTFSSSKNRPRLSPEEINRFYTSPQVEQHREEYEAIEKNSPINTLRESRIKRAEISPPASSSGGSIQRNIHKLASGGSKVKANPPFRTAPSGQVPSHGQVKLDGKEKEKELLQMMSSLFDDDADATNRPANLAQTMVFTAPSSDSSQSGPEEQSGSDQDDSDNDSGENLATVEQIPPTLKRSILTEEFFAKHKAQLESSNSLISPSKAMQIGQDLLQTLFRATQPLTTASTSARPEGDMDNLIETLSNQHTLPLTLAAKESLQTTIREHMTFLSSLETPNDLKKYDQIKAEISDKENEDLRCLKKFLLLSQEDREQTILRQVSHLFYQSGLVLLYYFYLAFYSMKTL
jgi:hypothetical protein